MDTGPSKEDQLKEAALDYHRNPTRGKIAVVPTKALSNQRDLSLAYSPGVAYACKRSPRTRPWRPNTRRAATWSR